ncbi:MAG: hypothetical protein IIB39_11290 [Candidatus Marinimicrobia bacterium]|nr:hypothetical protein [Candidatus Neomarinimicrobiota bacterium]
MAFNFTISNPGSGSVIEKESIHEATETLSKSLTNYLGYIDSDNRKTTAHAFITSLEGRFKPISTLAESLGFLFAKVGKLEILWFFDKIKKYADKNIEKHSLGDINSPFYSTQYLTAEKAYQISIIELEILTHVDELFLLLKTENEEESLKEIEKNVPAIKEKFERLDKYLDIRFELINSYSDRQIGISDRITELDSLIGKLQPNKSIIGLIENLENSYSDFPLIYLELLETFHNHIAKFRHIAESSDKYDQALIDYFNEYMRIIEISKSISQKGVLKNYEQVKMEELLSGSKSIIDISSKLTPIKKSSSKPDKIDNERSKISRFRLIIGIAVGLIILAIILLIVF